MLGSLIIFLCSVLLLGIAMALLFKDTFKSITTAAAEHSRLYAVAYAKATCLIIMAMGGNFRETFQPITVGQAATFAWWDWVIKFGSPVLAGMAVLVAFLDRSMQRADEVKAAKTGTTAAPFPTATIPP